MVDLCLLPAPAKMVMESGSIVLRDAQIVVPARPSEATRFAAMQLQQALREYAAQQAPIATAAAGGAAIRLSIDPSMKAGESYHLAIRHDGIALVGADEAGLFYAVQTLIQILRQRREHLPRLQINDAPDFPARGVMLDISRDKVPTLQTLFDLVDLLASWKINQVQLYMEHTFAYANHPEAGAMASPLTAEDILRLDAHCRQRHVQLVPNQNSFGHMERWLTLERYAHLAEAPEGADTPWNYRWPGPFSLCPTDPQSLELLRSLYAELLPNFRSRLFNVGCDETFDVGQGRSKLAVEKKGKTRVYLDFLLQIHKLVQDSGHTMMFWGDIIMHQPELIPELPKDIIALEWGYEANHPFDKDGEHFARAGVPFYVCPGTSSWCSIAGRTDNCLENLRNAAENGKKHGAIGYLNTDWGDKGHLQYLPISYLGFAAGAAYSWSVSANRNLDLCRALDLHAFFDAAGVMGRVAYELGNVYKQLKLVSNQSRLFQLLVGAPAEPPADVELKELEAALQSIEAAMAPLAASRMARRDAQLIREEFANVAAMLRHAAQRTRWQLGSKQHDALELAADLRQIIGRHETLWLARNRPGGLADSTKLLRDTLALYLGK